MVGETLFRGAMLNFVPIDMWPSKNGIQYGRYEVVQDYDHLRGWKTSRIVDHGERLGYRALPVIIKRGK